MESLSMAMRQELGLHNVKLILIRPGAINTGLLDEVKLLDNLQENSIYWSEFTRFSEIAQKEVGRIVEPSKVAKLVLKALTCKKPRLIYSINKNAKISFLVKFPNRWIDYLVKKTII
jgi:short-subunit dehydrogenase